MNFTILTLRAGLILCLWSGMAQSATAQAPNFEDDVKPILRTHCSSCHNEDDKEADVDLSTFASVLRGGSSGEIVKAGRPAASSLFQAIIHADNVEPMPPDDPKLSDAKIKVIDNWIRGGLIEGKGGKSRLRTVESVKLADGEVLVSPLPKDLKSKRTTSNRTPIPQAIAASPGAPLIATSGHEQILLFGGERDQVDAPFKLVGTLPFPEGNIHDLKFSRNGTLVLAAGGRGSHSGSVALYEVESGKRLGKFGDEVDSVLAADISPDHRFIAIGNSKKLVKIIDASVGKTLHTIKKHTDWITAISFSPDGKYVATGDRSGGLHVWEPDKGLIVFTLDEHKVQINSLSWRSDSRVLVSGAEDGNLVMWDIKDGFPIQNIKAHAAKSESRYTRKTGILSTMFNQSGDVLTAGRDGTIRSWDAQGKKKLELKIESSLPTGALWVGKQTVFAGTFAGKLLVFDADSKKKVQMLEN